MKIQLVKDGLKEVEAIAPLDKPHPTPSGWIECIRVNGRFQRDHESAPGYGTWLVRAETPGEQLDAMATRIGARRV